MRDGDTDDVVQTDGCSGEGRISWKQDGAFIESMCSTFRPDQEAFLVFSVGKSERGEAFSVHWWYPFSLELIVLPLLWKISPIVNTKMYPFRKTRPILQESGTEVPVCRAWMEGWIDG